ncbi:MAG: hypothetical protein AB8A41_01365 [Prochlorococcus sp.]
MLPKTDGHVYGASSGGWTGAATSDWCVSARVRPFRSLGSGRQRCR